MSTHHDWHLQHHWVFIFLAIFLGVMLLASIWWRFYEPSLTVHIVPQQREGGMPAVSDNGMNAVGSLMEHVAKNPHDVSAMLQLTENLMAMGQWDGAENFAQKAMSEPGDNARAMYLLAVIHHNKGQHAEAAELLEKLLKNGENPSARYSLGILYIYFLKNPELGREHLEQGLRDADTPEALTQAMREELDKLQAKAQGADGSAQTPANENAVTNPDAPTTPVMPEPASQTQPEN